MLDLGASPDYRDKNGLTPLYHACIVGGPTRCAEILLKVLLQEFILSDFNCECMWPSHSQLSQDHAQVGVLDGHGWSELHQAAKRGFEHHAELLIQYGAALDLRNDTGKTKDILVSFFEFSTYCATGSLISL
jgi:SH3/ankyrin repeat-containing protein